jgi:hypothetical protein
VVALCNLQIAVKFVNVGDIVAWREQTRVFSVLIVEVIIDRRHHAEADVRCRIIDRALQQNLLLLRRPVASVRMLREHGSQERALAASESFIGAIVRGHNNAIFLDEISDTLMRLGFKSDLALFISNVNRFARSEADERGGLSCHVARGA